MYPPLEGNTASFRDALSIKCLCERIPDQVWRKYSFGGIMRSHEFICADSAFNGGRQSRSTRDLIRRPKRQKRKTVKARFLVIARQFVPQTLCARGRIIRFGVDRGGVWARGILPGHGGQQGRLVESRTSSRWTIFSTSISMVASNGSHTNFNRACDPQTTLQNDP